MQNDLFWTTARTLAQYFVAFPWIAAHINNGHIVWGFSPIPAVSSLLQMFTA